jgi:predicted metal-dependent phosphoesterase TrpH
MKYANLHLHSVYSDSQFTPYQLVLIGKSLGYRALALTDHWSDAGFDEFFGYAKAEGIDAISGVEFDNSDLGASIHITALDFDRNDPKMRAMIKDQCDARTECTRKCFERGVALGFIQGATWDDVMDFSEEGAWVCIDHVIGALRRKKALDACGGSVALRNNVFKGPEIRAFSPKKPSMAEIIKTIRGAGGIATFAHPHDQIQYLPALLDMGLNGIEVCHPDLNDESARLAEEAAATYKLYRSGGTDHTGAMSGCGGAYAIPVYNGVTEEEYFTIKERRLG